MAVLPLGIKYTVVAKWRSPADGLGVFTVQAHCLSGYSHYPPPQPPNQLPLHQGAMLWLSWKAGMELGQGIIFREIFLHMCSLVSTVILSRSKACLGCYDR